MLEGEKQGSGMYQVDRLAEARGRCQHGGVQCAAGGGDDLATTTVDGICVEHHIAHLQAVEITFSKALTRVYILYPSR